MLSLLIDPTPEEMTMQTSKRQANETAFEWRQRVNGQTFDPASLYVPVKADESAPETAAA